MTDHSQAWPSAVQTPWLAPQIELLRRAKRASRFATGLMIHDERGAGGDALARFAAQLALCREADAPCGHCRDCRMFLVNQHPDFYEVGPIEDSKYIRIEQVRELVEQLTLTAHAGGATVALLNPADVLYPNASNALLKTLEEPRPAVSLILVCSVPSRLPATILSRCQRLRVLPPDRATGVTWLEKHRGEGPWAAVLDVLGNAPFEALRVNPSEVARIKTETERALNEAAAGQLQIGATAERWGAKGAPFELRLACLETWITARINESARAAPQSAELRSSAHLSEIASDMNMSLLLRVLDGASELRRMRLTSINRSLALEQLLWQLPRAFRGYKRTA
jgi:DNA polymerase III subunit delta'